MAGTTAELRGADNLARTLRGAVRDLADLTAASDQAADVVASRARGKAPKRTGRLAASIAGEGSPAEARAYATVPYAALIEYKYQPYLRPAAEETTGQWVGSYEGALGDIVGRIKGV